MTFNGDIIISKGGYSVTIWTNNVADSYKNSLTSIAGITSTSKSADGVEPTKVVDLLRVTHTIKVGGYLTKTATKTAKQVRDDLVEIFSGAEVDGGLPAELSFDGDTYNVYIEDLVFNKIVDDNVQSTYSGEDKAEYQVSITLIEGNIVGA